MDNLFQYIPRQSPVHRLDPRTKIIAVIAFSILILRADIRGLLMAAVVVFAVSGLSHLAPGYLIRALRPGLPFFICLFLVYLFFTPGLPLPGFPIGPVQITYQGLQLGLLQTAKFLLLILAAALLTMTTSASAITIGLEHLLRPINIIGLSSHDTALLVSLALRFVPTLLLEMNTINEARIARGADLTPRRISGKIRAITLLAEPLLLSIFRRSDELVEAMQARGYREGPRTYLYEPALTGTDYIIIITIMAALFSTLIW